MIICTTYARMFNWRQKGQRAPTHMNTHKTRRTKIPYTYVRISVLFSMPLCSICRPPSREFQAARRIRSGPCRWRIVNDCTPVWVVCHPNGIAFAWCTHACCYDFCDYCVVRCHHYIYVHYDTWKRATCLRAVWSQDFRHRTGHIRWHDNDVQIWCRSTCLCVIEHCGWWLFDLHTFEQQTKRDLLCDLWCIEIKRLLPWNLLPCQRQQTHSNLILLTITQNLSNHWFHIALVNPRHNFHTHPNHSHSMRIEFNSINTRRRSGDLLFASTNSSILVLTPQLTCLSMSTSADMYGTR